MRPSPEPPPSPPWWRRVAPYGLAAALLALVLWRVDGAAFVAALERTDAVRFVVFAAIFAVSLLAADAVAISAVYRAAVTPLGARDLFVIRGASYLPSLVNYHVGQAWLTYFVAKARGASLWRMSGATLLVYATTFGALFAVCSVGVVLSHERVPWLVPVLIGVAVAAALYLATIAARPRALAERRLLAPLFEVGVLGQLRLFALRLPHVAVLFVGTWMPLALFGVELSLGDALALVPVLMLVVGLPLTPQGVGTRDAVAVQLFAGFAPGAAAPEREATVVAATLCWAVVLTLLQAAIGLLLVPAARRRLRPD